LQGEVSGPDPLVDENATGHRHVEGFGGGPAGRPRKGDGSVEAVEYGGTEAVGFAAQDEDRWTGRGPGVGTYPLEVGAKEGPSGASEAVEKGAKRLGAGEL